MRAARAIASALGVALAFALALVVGAVVHLGLAPARRAIAARTNDALAPLFRGRITIQAIDRLSLRKLDARVRLDDDEGVQVLQANGVHVRFDVLALVGSLRSGGPISIDLTRASIDGLDLRLDANEAGSLAIARTFEPRTAASPSTSSSRGVRLSLPRVAVAHAWVHGVIPGAPLVDADLDAVHGAVLVAPSALSIDVDHVSVEARSIPVLQSAKGEIGAHLELPSAHGELGARATWRGSVGEVGESITASIDGSQLDVVVDAPTIAPDAVRAFWPGSTIAVDGTARVEAHGPLPKLELSARASLGAASVAIEGPVTIGPELRADMKLDSHAIDARAFSSGAPPSKLDAKGSVSFARHAGGAIDASAGIDFAGGPLGAQRAPAARLDARVTRDVAGRTSGDATVVSRDAKIPARATLRLVPKAASFELAYDFEARAPELGDVEWLGGAAHGATRIKARGVLDVARSAIDTHAEIELDEVARDAMHVHRATLALDARGPLRAPTIDATLHGDALDLGFIHVDSVHLDAHGPLSNAHVTVEVQGGNVPEVALEGNVGVLDGASLRDASLSLERNGERVRAHVDAVRVGGGRVKVDGALVEGLGSPARLSFDATRDSLQVDAEARDLHLGRVARLAGIEDRLRRGKLAVDVSLLVKRDGARGHVTVNLANGSAGDVEGVAAHVDASIAGRSITGTAHAQLADAGSIDVTTRGLQIDAKLPALEALRRPWGRVEIDGHAALAKVASLLPPNMLPVDVTGDILVHGRAWRDSPTDDTLGVLLDVTTSHLAVAARAPATWKVDDVDVALYARLDGDTGFTDVDARLNDARGELLAVDLKADTIPFGEVVASRERAIAALRSVVFNAQMLVPERPFDTLPALIAVVGLRGDVSARVDARGPLDRIVLDANGTVKAARLDQSDISMPLDFVLAGHYDGAHATATLGASARKRPVLDASAALDARVSDMLDGASLDVPWKASAKAHLDSFPLEGVSTLADHQVTGKVTGDLGVDGLHDDARATLSVGLSGLQVGDVVFPDGAMKVAIDGKSLDAMAKVDQTDGSFRATAHAGAAWGAALTPTLDPKAPLHAELAAKSFRAEAFLPFVDSTLTELDGRLDASANVTLDPVARKAVLEGNVTLKDGRFELAAVGGEFRDATATLKFTPDGVVTLENASANGMSGRVEAAATARVDGLGLVGANARVQIPKSKPLLLSVEGAQVGTVDGAVNLTATTSPDRRALAVKVDVPSLHVQLPEQTTRDIQPLGAIAGVSLGVTSGSSFKPASLDPVVAEPPARAADATRIDVTVSLSDDVQVKRGSTVSISLEGHPTVAVTDRTRVGGQIRLSGSIDVQGKKFDIEDGTVTFVSDDPSNPQIVLTASWTADDDDQTRVYANFVGPLKTGKVTLTSEPSHSENEILSLLLFGTIDGMSTNSQSSATTTVGAAGGAATQPVNRALQQFGLGGVQTRVDTSSTNPRPEVEVQIARSISLQIAWVLAVSPGQNPDTTLLTFDWRFLRAWSLATTVGNAGTSVVDLLWHYRY